MNTIRTNYKTQIATQGPIVGLTAAQITQQLTYIQKLIDGINDIQAKKDALSSSVANFKTIETNNLLPLKTEIARFKTSATFTPAIGQILGVIGTVSNIDTANYKCKFTAEHFGGFIRIKFVKAGVDGVNIHHMNQTAFEQALIAANKVRSSVRALTWTNQKAIHYNNLVAQALSGTSDIKLGDVLVVNKQVIHGVAKYKLPTESTVEVVGISNWYVDSNGITVRNVDISRGITLRVPKDMVDTVPIIKAAYDKGRSDVAYVLENLYVDLRHMYGSTVNKSQGSTYHTVFIDLSDIGACKDRDQVKRMLYVAASRASDQVVFTGDI